MIADAQTHMSRTIDVWWIRWDKEIPSIVHDKSIRTVVWTSDRPSVWFSKQEVLNDPELPIFVKSRFEAGPPYNRWEWELVCTPIAFTEEELNEALHH